MKVVPTNDITEYYSLYQQEIRLYLTKKLACADTAADLTQEAFIRLLKSGPNLELKSPRAYLYSIATNLLNDYFRFQKKQPSFIESEAIYSVADNAPDQERQLLAEKEVHDLEIAIAQLSPRCREVFVLHKFHHLSYEEISQQLNISKNTVMVHMMNALSHCRKALNKK